MKTVLRRTVTLLLLSLLTPTMAWAIEDLCFIVYMQYGGVSMDDVTFIVKRNGTEVGTLSGEWDAIYLAPADYTIEVKTTGNYGVYVSYDDIESWEFYSHRQNPTKKVTTNGNTASFSLSDLGGRNECEMWILVDRNNDYYLNTSENTFNIMSADGWNEYCNKLDNNNTYNQYKGLTVKLNKDISVSGMVGSSAHPFCGTFDGQGKKLTFNCTANSNYAAPFRYVNGATIKNLNVCGTIITSGMYASGLVAHTSGSTSITNCCNKVVINSQVNGDGSHGGFAGIINEGSLSISGCVFSGKFLGPDTHSCGGFVGFNNGALSIANSIFAPAEFNISTINSATFSRYDTQNNSRIPQITNCYYNTSVGYNQGKNMYSINAGKFVTLGFVGTATEYNVSGITAYAANTGLKYGNSCYAGFNEQVTLILSKEGDTPDGYEALSGYQVNSGALSGSVLTMGNANVTVNAFSPISYSIIYHQNVDGFNPLPASYTIEDGVITLPTPDIKGYNYRWYTNSGYNGSFVTTIGTGSTGKKEFWGRKEAIDYSLNYNLNGGSLPAGKSNPDSYTVSDKGFILINPTREGYCFTGWEYEFIEHGDTTVRNSYFVEVVPDWIQDIELTATWINEDNTHKDFAKCTAIVPDPMYTGGNVGYGFTLEGHGGIVVRDIQDKELTYGTDYSYSGIVSLDGGNCDTLGEHCRVFLNGCGNYVGSLYVDVEIVFISAVGNTKAVADDDSTETWFDLSGHKLPSRPVVNGVYILNGKKATINF